LYLGVSRKTLHNYEKGKAISEWYDGLDEVVEMAKLRIQADQEEKTLTGEYNSNFTKFLFSNYFGLHDSQYIKTEQEIKLEDKNKREIYEKVRKTKKGQKAIQDLWNVLREKKTNEKE